MSICEQQMGVGQLGAFHKSIIDRCTANIYHDFIKSGGEGRIPTLPDWRNEVKRQPGVKHRNWPLHRAVRGGQLEYVCP